MFELYAYDSRTRTFYPTNRYSFYTIEEAKKLYREKYGLKYKRITFKVQVTR